MNSLYDDLSGMIDKLNGDQKDDVKQIKESLKTLKERTEKIEVSVLSIEEKVDIISKTVAELLLRSEMENLDGND